jgi:RNA polymerase sigma factor (sigma-70 family)
MANGTSNLLIRSIHDLVGTQGASELSDRELVERFADHSDGEAFAALVRRHGAMVLGVCRRIIGHEHDAEDVFQAVFLVLSRKAGGLRRKEAVGPWLFGVAHRLALRARLKGRQRQQRETKAPEVIPDEPFDELTLREARAVLDEELARLPERERGPLILCYLEGLTRDQAAQRLGCALGTLKGRLERGRAALQKRLTQRGLGLLGVLPTLVLTRESASATIALQTAAVEAALAFVGRSVVGRAIPPEVVVLAEEMLKPTLAGKLAIATVVLLGVVACGFGVGLIGSPSDAARSESRTAPVPAVARLESRAMPGPTVNPRATEKQRPSETPSAPEPTEKQAGTEKPADQASKNQEAEALPSVVKGVATAVDADKGTLLVAHRDGEDTFTVADGATIEIDGKPGELARLPAGADVHLTRFVGPKTAGSIQASGRQYFGNPVKAVDAQRNTITITDITDREQEKTFAVARNALIWVDGKGAKLAAVPPGSFVNLDLAVDQQTALSIGADGPNLGGCGGSLVQAVDIQKRTITYDKKAPRDIAGKTFTIAQDAFITINGNKTGTLADVPVGCYVNLLLRVDGRMARQVHAQGPSNLCKPGGSVVKGVDVEKGTITFDESAGAELAGKTFTLAKDANIVIDGKPGKLSALPPGSLVDIHVWVDRQTVGNLHTCGQPVPGIGVVKAVDAGKNTITIGDTTYPVAKDAIIQIAGKTVRLAEVPTGVSVSLRLNVDRKTVGFIHHTKS